MMNDTLRNCIAFLGRLLLSQIFIASGVMKVFAWTKTAEHMQQAGMVAVPFFLAAAIFVEIVAGLMILINWNAAFAAWVLFLYLIPVSVIFHNFWKYTGQMQENQMQHFVKNVTIMGGLLMLSVLRTGRTAFQPSEQRGTMETHQLEHELAV